MNSRNCAEDLCDEGTLLIGSFDELLNAAKFLITYGRLYALLHGRSRTAYLYRCLEWYNGSITPRVHSGVTKRIQSRLHYRPTATVQYMCYHCLEYISSFNTHLYYSRQWFNMHVFIHAYIRGAVKKF